jgi:hypothetical protein
MSKSTAKMPLLLLWGLAAVGGMAYFINQYIELCVICITLMAFFYYQQRASANLKAHYIYFRERYFTYIACVLGASAISTIIYHQNKLPSLLILIIPFIYFTKVFFCFSTLSGLWRLFRAKSAVAV